jgi:hypothetical protein
MKIPSSYKRLSEMTDRDRLELCRQWREYEAWQYKQREEDWQQHKAAMSATIDALRIALETEAPGKYTEHGALRETLIVQKTAADYGRLGT